MKHITYPAGVYQANCYIIYDEKSMKGIIIDPGGETEEIEKLVNDEGIDPQFILLTHGHFDHTGAVNHIKAAFNIPVYMNEKDLFLVSGNEKKKASFLPASDLINIDRYVKDGDVIEYGNENVRILETPGHTPGGISVSTGGCLFSGDTLFYGSVGRTDLPGGSHEQLIESIKSKLMVLDDDTFVYPGHGPSTTIGREKRNNPFL